VGRSLASKDRHLMTKSFTLTPICLESVGTFFSFRFNSS
jgi:hypothetical protein